MLLMNTGIADAAVLVHHHLHVAVHLLALGLVGSRRGRRRSSWSKFSFFQPDSFQWRVGLVEQREQHVGASAAD